MNEFSSRWSAAKGDKWPFVYATGDPTGFSWHGDFQNGYAALNMSCEETEGLQLFPYRWETTALQNAIDKCNNKNDDTGSGVTEACKFLTVRKASVANTCKIKAIVNVRCFVTSFHCVP